MIDLLQYFGGAFVINLDRRGDRLDEFLTRARRARISGIQKVSAIDGGKCLPPEWWRAGDGAWGCMMSHVRLAQDCLMKGLSSYVVFEDDAVFSDQFSETLPRIMDRLDGVGWDQLYLGGQHLYVEASPPWPFRKEIVRCANVNRTHGYAVNAKFMAKLAQHALHAPDYIRENERLAEHDKAWHFDHQMGLLHERRQDVILAAHPWIVGQAAGDSDILGEMKPEMWWQDEGWGK